jgi:hypothetical protein
MAPFHETATPGKPPDRVDEWSQELREDRGVGDLLREMKVL